MPRFRSLCLLTLTFVAALAAFRRHGTADERAKRGPIHDMYVMSGDQFTVGTTAGVRVLVRAARSLTESGAVADAEVSAVLETGGTPREVFRGRTDERGGAMVRFVVPEMADGQGVLTVTTKSPFGEKTLRRTIHSRHAMTAAVSLDKGLFQPGQVVRFRARFADEGRRAALAGVEARIDVKDPRGTLVHRQTGRTSDQGIVSGEIALSAEAASGSWSVVATTGEVTGSMPFQVRRYDLPKFSVSVVPEKGWYRPGETVRGTVEAKYLFGKPVAGAMFRLKISTWGGEGNEDVAEFRSNLDAAGRAPFETTLREGLCQTADGGLRFDLLVIDATGDRVEGWEDARVTRDALAIGMYPESGTLVPGVANRVWVVTATGDGKPAAAGVEVEVPGGEVPLFRAELRTGADGIGSFEFVPGPRHLKLREGPAKVEFGRTGAPAGGMEVEFVAGARDGAGGTGRLARRLPCGAAFGLLLRLDSAFYVEGQIAKAEVVCGRAVDAVYVEIVRDGQVLGAVSSRPGAFSIPLDAGMTGLLAVHAYALMPDGGVIADSQAIVVSPSGDLRMTITPDRPAYRPGEEAVVQFHVTDRSGRPVAAAIGVTAIDEALLQLTGGQHGMEDFRTGAREVSLTAPWPLKQGLTSSDLARNPAGSGAYGRILLSGREPVPAFPWVENPQVERLQSARHQLRRLITGVRRHILAGGEFARQAPDGTWGWRDDLLDLVRERGEVPPQDFQDPWGAGVTMEALSLADPRFSFEESVLRLREKRLKDLETKIWKAAPVTDLVTTDGKLRPGLLSELNLGSERCDPFGKPWDLEALAREDAAFTPANLARLQDQARKFVVFQALTHAVVKSGIGRYAGNGRWKPDVLALLAADCNLRPAVILSSDGKMFDLPAMKNEWESPQAAFRALSKLREAVFAGLRKFGEKYAACLDEELGNFTFPDDVLDHLVLPASIAGLKDPWGGRIVLARGPRFYTGVYRVELYETRSNGPDGAAGTADDITGQPPLKPFEADPELKSRVGPAFAWILQETMNDLWQDEVDEWLSEVGGGDGGRYGGRLGGRRNLVARGGGSSGPGRVREQFPETLVWAPELVTDAGGNATLRFSVADSITTWRIVAVASTGACDLGGAEGQIRVFQDFFADLNVPASVTQGDEISVPASVWNYSDRKLDVVLELEPGDDFRLVKSGPATLSLEPGTVATTHFRVRATGLGRALLTLRASGGALKDAVRRPVEILPDGKPVEQAWNEILGDPVERAIEIPEGAIPDTARLELRVMPGIFSQATEGIDGMIGKPWGCFEQSTSVTWPNIAILEYLRRMNRTNPELERRATAFVEEGYQKLLRFETSTGGFSLYGSGRGNLILTSIAIAQLRDFARLRPVDEPLVARTREWLFKNQSADGSWDLPPNERASWTWRGLSGTLVVTSYVLTALGTDDDPRLERAREWIRHHLDNTAGNGYAFALAANALASKDPADPAARKMLETLEKSAIRDERGAHWEAATARTATWGYGATAHVETTALAALALLRDPARAPLAKEALAWIVRTRRSNGTWGTTAATVLSLRALFAGCTSRPIEGSVTLPVRVNGEDRSLTITADQADVTRTVDLTPLLHPGKNTFSIGRIGRGDFSAQIVARHFAPWTPADAEPGAVFDVRLAYDDRTITSGQSFIARFEILYRGAEPTSSVVAEIGLPPGCDVARDTLDKLVQEGKIDRYEIGTRSVALYIPSMRRGDAVDGALAMRPSFPMKARTFRSEVFEYYAPENRTVIPPFRVRVK